MLGPCLTLPRRFVQPMFHALLGSSINSRRVFRDLQGDSLMMVADFERVISLGRELGQHYLEFTGHQNLGEFLYWMDRLDEAAVHVARAQATCERWAVGGWRPETVLLEARIALYRGEIARARTVASRVRGDGSDPLAVPANDVFCSMVELATSEMDESAWDELEERAAKFAVWQERIEVVEARGLVELRRGNIDAARCHLERAAELATQVPNVLRERIMRRLANMRTSQSPKA